MEDIIKKYKEGGKKVIDNFYADKRAYYKLHLLLLSDADKYVITSNLHPDLKKALRHANKTNLNKKN